MNPQLLLPLVVFTLLLVIDVPMAICLGAAASLALLPRFAIGIDFRTNSVRAVVVDIATGGEVGTHAYDYASDAAGVLLDRLDPNLARQNPADHIKGLVYAIKAAVQGARLE